MDSESRLRARAFADAHQSFLSIRHPQIFAELQASGELRGYLKRKGRECSDFYERAFNQLFDQAMRRNDYWERVRALESASQIASELTDEKKVNTFQDD